MPKREAMRRRAKKQLAKREQEEPSTPQNIEKEKSTPSYMSGFFLIFFGSITFTLFYSLDQILVGFLASAAFIVIGMSRIFRASAARAKPEKLSS